MAELTEAEVIRDLAYGARRWHAVEPGRQYAWLDGDGEIGQLDLSGDMPALKTGRVTVRDAGSFQTYWDKHHDEASEVYADLEAATVTAVLDAHEQAGARWQQHRLVLALTPTLAWQAWLKYDRVMMPQVAFAEHLEDNYRDLAPDGPVSAADFLEIAQRFQATTKADWKGGTRLATGELQFSYEESTQATGGPKRIEIPSQFTLMITPYEDCPPGVITARFRYRLSPPDGLKLGYFLDQPERVRQDAVAAIAARAGEDCGAGIMRGSAP